MNALAVGWAFGVLRKLPVDPRMLRSAHVRADVRECETLIRVHHGEKDARAFRSMVRARYRLAVARYGRDGGGLES